MLEAKEALRIFKGISKDDMILLGFNPDYSKPESMII